MLDVDVVGGCGGFSSFFFSIVVCDCGGFDWWLVAVMVGGCSGCGMRGWMRWPAVLRIIGMRKRETEEREGKIKNDKERIFKWNVKKNRSFDRRDVVKWGVICYKIGI